MKEICVDARMGMHSGIGTYIRNILPFLKNAFPSLRVLAPLSLMEVWPELKTFDIIPLKSALYTIQEQMELPLRIPACDLYWTPHYNIPIFPIKAKKRIVTIHDVYHLAYGQTLSLPKRIYAKMMIKSAVAISDHIITVSQFSQDEMIKHTGVSTDKISVIHNGVNTNLFSLHVQNPLPQNYFLFVSTLAPHKNLTRLLRAWNLVIQKHKEWHLALVGKTVKNVEYLKVFEVFPHLRQHVRFLGQVAEKDLPELYQSAYATISPSFYEGFGFAPLEAMAMGCPAVVSSVASYPEVCGNAALYVNPFDIEDMAQKICDLIENPLIRPSLIERGKARVDEFTWEKAAQNHVKVMDELL
ncbi:MAG: glycosyltransferase family 4 protein [Rhabdochlamydiaceae bacterium]|nr:glycosyltransferase family 4 protein [Rhabdochlamydiaceae bacterium]